MKIKRITIYIWILICSLLSCQKYVDIKKSSQQNQIQSISDCQLLLDNYANMNTNYPSDSESSSDNYVLSGQSYISLDLENQAVYNWLRTAVRQGASPQWQSPYKVVFFSNLVLETLEKLEKDKPSIDSQKQIDVVKGAALFFRAYALWNIAQIYARAYDSQTSLQDLGIPRRLSSDINDKSERGTVKQTYDGIVDDLKQAANLLEVTSVTPTRPNKVAAFSMLARVYLSMEDYSNCFINANSALQLKSDLLDYNTVSRTALNPFARFNKEVIFHSIITTSDLLKPGTQNSPFARVDPDLVNLYQPNDLRRSIFLKPNNSPVRNAQTGIVSNLPDGTYRFSGNYEPSNSGNANQFNGLAVDELYLIRAECYARADQVTEAMADLNLLLKNRWVIGTYVNQNANSPEEALTIILKERRKELIMRSQRWTDLRRLNKDLRFKKDLVRSTNFVPSTDVTVPTLPAIISNLPANDLRYTLLIPQEVISNSQITQNPR